MSSAHEVTRPFGLGIELLNRIDYRLAETEADKDAIYRLRYRAYLNEAAIEPNPDRKVSDRFDELPNSWVFGVYFEGVLASSIRISVASPEHMDTPSVAVFADVLKPMLAQGKVMIDPTRFVADPDRAKRLPELPYVTLRLAYVATSYFNAHVGLAAVRAEHQAFYRRFFMHRLWSPPRPFAGLLKPICLMAVDDPAVRDKVYERFPYLVSSAAEQRMLFTRCTEREHHAAPADRLASPCLHP